ncbi:hypothetical protein [Acinetobacter guillouiae]|uniref:hypothetical protein n=2 Tax=Acinetobacter guillouiae TaxID=106649 RepID=UPI001D189C4F|nr:hypothetical protein [Acinetobacter guillouiae]
MENQKIRILIKRITFSLLFFGITTMNNAQDFQIKHIYTPVVKTLGQHSTVVTFPVYYPIAISNDDYVLTKNLSGIFSIKSDEFGIFKAPLTEEMKRRMIEVNRILGIPKIEKFLATKNKERDFIYVLDNNTSRQKNGTIEGFQIYDKWNTDEFIKHGKQSQVKHSKLISDFISDLEDIGYSKNTEKFADFYGTTNIIPKKEGLEVILTLKNVGPFDITFSNPSKWGDIIDLEEPFDENKIWYEVRLGAQCHEKSCWTRFALMPENLIKDDFKPEELARSDFKIESNGERNFRYLIPYNKITTTFTNGEVNTNRTKEGYIHFDQGLALKLTFWNMYVSFGDIFSKQVWKEEKSSQVKSWINLQ